MAGSAGTLEIELIADVARLKQDMREMERTVGAANDNIQRSTTRAGSAFGGFNKGVDGAGKSTKLAGHHMANLSFQLQDIAVSLQGGQKPMTVLMQQGGQIAQIMAQAGVGVGGLARAVGSMALNFAKAHPVLLGLTVAAGGLVAGMSSLAKEVNKDADLKNYAKSLGLTKEEMKKLSSTSVTTGDAFKGLWKTILDSSQADEKIGKLWDSVKSYAGDALKFLWEATKNTVAGIYAGFAGSIKAVSILWNQLPGVVGEAMAGLANVALSALEDMLNKWVARMNLLIAGVNMISPFADVPMIAEVSLGRVENRWAGAAARMNKDMRGVFTSSFSDAEGWLDDFGKRLMDNIAGASRERLKKDAEKIIGDRTGKSNAQKAKELSDLEKAYQKAKEAADDYLAGLVKENEQLGKNSIELKKMEIAAAAAAAEKAGLVEEAKKIRAEGEKLVEGMHKEASVRYKEQIQSIRDEIAVMRLVGPERELAALALEEQAFKARAAADGVKDVEAAWREYLQVRTEQINLQSVLDKDREAADRLDEALRGVLGTLGNIGGFSGVLGGLVDGLMTGNFNGMGPIGQIFTILTSPMGELDKAIGKMSKTMTDVFGIGGSLANTLSKGLMGAAIGGAASSVVFGKDQSKGTQIGSSLGGAVGGLLTKTAFGGAFKFLGAAAGPVGAIVGSLLGGLVGGLFGGTPRASVNIGGSGNTLKATDGDRKDKKMLAQSQQAASGIIGTINDIASALGGTVNASAGRVSIGQRKGKWVVDVNGTGKTKGSGTVSFGEDAGAAAQYAIQNLIKDGVLQGIRNSTMNLLRAGGDLNKQLEKALAFEQVFKDLASSSNPFKASLESLKAEFEKLKGIFQEAGATTAEYAQLNQLLLKRQKELVDQAMSNYRSTFYTDEQNLAIARKTIQETMAALNYSTVDTVDEFKALVEATDALAKPELFGALMELVDEFGLVKEAADKAAEAAAAEAEAKKTQVEEARRQREADIEEAKANLRSAYETQRQELLSTVDQFKEFASTLRDFRASLFAVEGSGNSYLKALAELRRVGQLASVGDADSLGQLQGVSSAFLSEAKDRAGSQAEYLRDVARVAQYVDSAISASDSMVSETERQLALLDQQVSALIDINEGVQTVAEAIQRLEELLASPVPSLPEAAPITQQVQPIIQVLEDQVNTLSNSMAVVEESSLRQERAILRMEGFWQRLSPDGLGLLVRADADVPLTVVALP